MYCNNHIWKNKIQGLGRWLSVRSLDALAVDLDSIAHVHMAAHNHLSPQFYGTDTLLWPPGASSKALEHIKIRADKSFKEHLRYRIKWFVFTDLWNQHCGKLWNIFITFKWNLFDITPHPQTIANVFSMCIEFSVVLSLPPSLPFSPPASLSLCWMKCGVHVHVWLCMLVLACLG